MYCTVEAFLRCQKPVANTLSNPSIYFVDLETGVVYNKGSLDGLSIKENQTGIKISGSLAKFYYGNNFETLTMEDTKRAIEKISDGLHIDVKQADLRRVDYATNLIVSEPPVNYYSFFWDARRMNRSQLGTTLYFTNKTRSLVFYDKGSEAQAHKTTIPEQYINKNVLRYEYRLKRLKRDQLIMADLFTDTTFNWLICEWLNRYRAIRRIPRFRIKKEKKDMINLKSFEIEGWKLLIKKIGGIENFYTLLDDEARRGSISKQNKYYFKKKISEILSQSDIFEPSPLVIELDEKVTAAAERYRS